MKTHGGIPHGSTLNLGGELQIYYQWNEGITTATETVIDEEGGERSSTVVNQWNDQGTNSNNASQSTTENKPLLATDNGVEFFNYEDDGSYADAMTCTKFTVSAEAQFLSFIVCSLGSNATVCYLSDSGGEVFQYTSANAHQLKAAGTTSNMTHSGKFTFPTDTKHLMIVHRPDTSAIKLYKNGLECDGHNDGGTTNNGGFDVVNIGSKNVASNWFDGVIYDLGFIDGALATNANRKLIEDYLLTKHGLERLGND